MNKIIVFLGTNTSSEDSKIWNKWTAEQGEIEYKETTTITLTDFAKRKRDGESIYAVYTGEQSNTIEYLSDYEGVTFTSSEMALIADYTDTSDSSMESFTTRVQRKITKLFRFGMHPKRISKETYDQIRRET